MKYCIDLCRDHKIKGLIPNTFLLNNVLHAWSQSDDPNSGESAEALLLDMEKQFDEEGKFEMKPNTKTYVSVLVAWGRSKSPEKAKRAKIILDRMDTVSVAESRNKMKNENVCKTVPCYNFVINAAAFTDETIPIDQRMEAFDVATATLEELLQSNKLKPDSNSFALYIKACGKLALPSHIVQPAMEKAFNTCKQLGLDSEYVLNQLHYARKIIQEQNEAITTLKFD
eukprot:CAMPEP_0184868714 /NCGR_PEP_ID=MMETSP0580-20130426/31502_1 /TAXON_ID=1118495 /ORGANISM="Dactyliosolen fragilissimus" /LENGTH=226 /DNA_ID=CAMNT_0027369781 /DNA_START=413 /DNA_END=1091 /DNA_ORIENTATION=-